MSSESILEGPSVRKNLIQIAHNEDSKGRVAGSRTNHTALSHPSWASKTEPRTQLLLFYLPCRVVRFLIHDFVYHPRLGLKPLVLRYQGIYLGCPENRCFDRV
jgi:hypothetical protein